jgi:hypothetical protein
MRIGDMREWTSIAAGTAVVGTLDALDAIIYVGLRGGTPVRMFQGIASGLLGRESFRGGAATAALGALIHYTIAFGIVLTYHVASRRIAVLTRRPFLCGALYGIGVYAFMNLVVIPLSAIGPQRFTLAPFVNGILIHIVGIGIPSALFAAAVHKSAA